MNTLIFSLETASGRRELPETVGRGVLFFSNGQKDSCFFVLLQAFSPFLQKKLQAAYTKIRIYNVFSTKANSLPEKRAFCTTSGLCSRYPSLPRSITTVVLLRTP